jgi:MIP family channel proteins
MFNSKVFLAEFIGTFALVFIGAGSGVAGAGLVGVALAHGLTVAAFVYTFGYISGTHINPAVTFALAFNNTIKWGEALFYWIAQFAGAILAAFALRTFFGDISAGATVGSLTTTSPILAMTVEAILTFFLVNAVLHNAIAGSSGKFAGLAIGLTLVAAILVGGPLTGASLNPARTFGPALFGAPDLANWINLLITYLFGPLIGATLALLAFNFFTDADAKAAEAEKKAVKKASKKK